LLEATAKRVLESTGNSYAGRDFPGILFHAFTSVDLPVPSGRIINVAHTSSTRNPRAAVVQALYLLGVQVNRLRNAEGTGHGRPFSPSVTDKEASVAAQAMALISELLLTAEAERSAPDSAAA